jgi:hypothetical protein
MLGLPPGLSNRQLARWARTLSRDATSVGVYIMRPPPPPPPPEAMKRATPENRRLADLIDTLDQLDDAALRRVRESTALATAAGGRPDAAAGQELKLEATEFLAQRRRIAPLSLKSEDSPTARRLFVRTSIQDGITKGGSFKKALSAFRHAQLDHMKGDAFERSAASFKRASELEPDIKFYEQQAESFGRDFTRQARMNATRLLDGSLKAMGEVLSSYGIPAGTVGRSAERLVGGASSLDAEADRVVSLAAKEKQIDAPGHVAHRHDLATEIKNLRNQQLLVAEAKKRANLAVNNAPINGQGPTWDLVKESRQRLAHEQAALKRYWIEAERKHPIIAAFRRGEDIEKVDLGTLGIDSVQDDMKIVVLKILPKVVDILRVKHLVALGPENHGISPCALTPVVALTRANMFIPDGSLRAGVVKDLVDDAADTDPTWVKAVAIALAIVTLIPSGGTSLAIPIGMASASFAAYSAGSAWREYDINRSLANTDLDLARSLSTVEPSLTGFAVSLVTLGLEAIPLIHAFNTARKIKALMNEGKNVEHLVSELNRLGEASPAKVKGLGEEARAEAEAANRQAAKAVAAAPEAPGGAPAPLKPPPRDPTLHENVPGVTYTDARQLQEDLATELKQHLHGTADMNPDMAWVMEHIAEAPDTSTNWQLLKVLKPYYATIRDPDKAAEFAAFLYRTAAQRRITVRRALVEYVSGAATPISIRDLGKAELLKDVPFIDLGFARDTHGAYTHMFQEGLIDFAHGRGEGRRLRHLIGRATGPPGVRQGTQEFFGTVWDAFYDDLTGNPTDPTTGTHVNRPEVLGPLLQKYIGLPL